MKIVITGRKCSPRESFKERAEKKLAKVERFFGDEAEAKITATVEKSGQTVEITVINNGMIFRAQERAENMNDALDKCVDSLVRQIRKNKTRVEKKLKEAAFTGMLEEPVVEADHEVIRHKKFVMHPMDLDEAILQMDLLGHSFFMFTNANTGEVNVVYKRADGKYAVLEPIYE